MTREELLAKYSEPIKVGQHGHVKLMDCMGSDQSIAQAARTSYQSGTKSIREDTQLIRYLIQNHHSSPLEQAVIQFHIKCPIYVRNQFVRHRQQSMNEYSLRYSVAPEEIETTLPDHWRTQDTVNKQGSSGYLDSVIGSDLTDLELDHRDSAKALHKRFIETGVAREQARKVLPLSQYTEYVTRFDLHNLLHLLHLRLDSHAQLEIREFAEAIATIVSDWCPAAWSAYKNFVIDSVTFSNEELAALRVILPIGVSTFLSWSPDHRKALFEQHGIVAKSERLALFNKLQKLI